MIAFVIRRLAQGVVVMLVVGFIAFSLFNFVGDPVALMLPPEATQADRERMRESLGLDRPFYLQFASFLANATQGNFGISLRLGRPVSALLVERLPATLELALAAAALGLLAGVPLGVLTALRRDSWSSRAILTTSLVGVSLPNFLIGIFLILVFAVWLGVLPSFGRGETVALGPWTTGLLTASGLKALILRTDYIKVARARGLTNRAVHFGHALRNTLVPVITITGLQLGGIIAFAIITETVFQWPGMGLLFIQAVQFADIPVMAAYLCLIGLIFVAINLVVDILYYMVDPRLRIDGAMAGAHG
jgi:peptide/nickel transport system permease protein